MHLRIAFFQAAQHLAIPIERQFRMQTADNMKLRDRFADTVARALPHLFERHGVSGRILRALPERAEAATGDAYIGGIDVAIHVEISLVAMEALADLVRHPADT